MQCRLDHALLTEQHDGDIPAREWIAFGDRDQKIDRVVYLLHHSDDEHPDRFYQMNEQMTVFGFGRQAFTNISTAYRIVLQLVFWKPQTMTR